MKYYEKLFGRIRENYHSGFCTYRNFSFCVWECDEQLIGMLRKVEPKATVEHQDNSGIVGNITSRESPILTIEKRTFLAGRTYNLLDGTEARNADGQYLPVQIEKIVNPENEEITEMVDIQNFVPKCGAYQITYSAEETYMTVKKKTEKTIVFVAD